jgi:hypothetical protein
MAITPLGTAQQQEIVEMPITGDPFKRTPRNQIMMEKPIVTGAKEPIFLIDWSQSNRSRIAQDSSMTKVEFLQICLPLAAGILGADDSKAASEKGTKLGGVRSYAFNEPRRFGPWDADEDEFDDLRDLGDLSEANAPEALALHNFDGRTFIEPALEAAEIGYEHEFGHLPLEEQPTAMIVVWTDGELNDEKDFEAWLQVPTDKRKRMRKRVVGVAVYGEGNGHDAAVAAYRRIAASHPDVSVAALTGVSSPQEAVLDVQLMAA